jgi:hypothetical protein
MRKLLIAFACSLFFGCTLHAQILATTEEGDTVLLNSDGTWAYLDTSEISDEVLPVNDGKFVKSSS